MDHSATSQSHCIMMYRRGRVVDAMVAQLEFRAGGKGIDECWAETGIRQGGWKGDALTVTVTAAKSTARGLRHDEESVLSVAELCK